MYLWEWQQILYFFLFMLSVPLLESWKERFSVFIVAVSFTVSRPIRIFLGFEGDTHLLFYIIYEVLVTLIVSLLLIKTERYKYFLLLQLSSILYLCYELVNWNSYTYTWDYYSYIQILLLDFTLAVLVVSKNNYLTILHTILYTLMSLVLVFMGKQ